MDEAKRAGLDETRRLLYTIAVKLARWEVPGAELVGTVVNALRHHHPDLAIDVDQLYGLLLRSEVTAGAIMAVPAAIEVVTAAIGD